MKIPQFKPVFTKEMADAALNALQNERFILGESVDKFEEEFARYIGTDYCVSVSSGTHALQFSLEAIGAKKAVTVPTSFIASSNAVLHAGGKPSFVDVDEQGNMNPTQLGKSDAYIPVHLYGHPAQMNEVLEKAKQNKARVIEDACQAHGALYEKKKVGSLADAGCFSFYTTKNMMAGGDGGALTTNDQKIADFAKSARNCGRDLKDRDAHSIIGYTARFNTVKAAIAPVQLKNLDKWNEKHREIASWYRAKLSKEVQIPERANVKSCYYQFAIRVSRRDEFKKFMAEQGVETVLHYKTPIHLQPPYLKMGFKKGDFPQAEKFEAETISLPMFIDLTKEQAGYLCEKANEFSSKQQSCQK